MSSKLQKASRLLDLQLQFIFIVAHKKITKRDQITMHSTLM